MVLLVTESHPQCADKLPRQKEQVSLRWTWSVWIVFAGMLAFQPNYAWKDGTRTAPYGSDFLQEWIGGRIVLSGESSRLYDWDYATALQHNPDVVGYSRGGDGFYPMVYPPYWYIACAPFVVIPLKWAAPLWLGFLTAVWFFGIRWLMRADGKLGKAIGRAPQLAVICGPLLLSYGLGQKAGLITLTLLVTAVLLEHRRILTAGLVFGLLAFKPHMALLMGIPLALRFGTRFVIGSTTTLVAALLLTVAVDPALLGHYIQVAMENASGNYSAHAGYRLDDAHNWAGFWNRLFGVGETSRTLTAIWSLATVGVVAFIAARRFGKAVTTSEWTVFTCGLILASPHFYGYDLAILLLPGWWLIRDLDSRPTAAVVCGVVVWYGLMVLPHLAKDPIIPFQWTAFAVLLTLSFSVARELGLSIPLPRLSRHRSVTSKA